MLKQIEIARLRTDGGTQPRAELHRETVEEYAAALKAGETFPAVIVFHDGVEYWLADGFHRVNAARLAGRALIAVDVRQGTRRDAVLFACGANHGHGLRRTTADKRRAVETLLRDEEWRTWSDRVIAEKCAVDQKTVWSLRAELIRSEEIPHLSKRTGKDGKKQSATKRKAASEPGQEPEPEPEPEAESEPAELAPMIPDEELHAAQRKVAEESEKEFNRTNDNVEWALWTWNPVTGCLHDCDYCYARDIANRFYPEKFAPTFRPERLKAPQNTKRPPESKIAQPFDGKGGGIGERNVFVCSMADLFGKWVPREWVEAVLAEVRSNPQWTFLMLSKFPQRMAEFEYPENVWLGTTVDKQHAVERAERAFVKVKASGFKGVCWLSCEPMLERLTFSSLGMFDWVVMGGARASTKTPEYAPPFDDIVHLHHQARAAGCRIYQKTNLIPEMQTSPRRVREYPVITKQ